MNNSTASVSTALDLLRAAETLARGLDDTGLNVWERYAALLLGGVLIDRLDLVGADLLDLLGDLREAEASVAWRDEAKGAQWREDAAVLRRSVLEVVA